MFLSQNNNNKKKKEKRRRSERRRRIRRRAGRWETSGTEGSVYGIEGDLFKKLAYTIPHIKAETSHSLGDPRKQWHS